MTGQEKRALQRKFVFSNHELGRKSFPLGKIFCRASELQNMFQAKREKQSSQHVFQAFQMSHNTSLQFHFATPSNSSGHERQSTFEVYRKSKLQTIEILTGVMSKWYLNLSLDTNKIRLKQPHRFIFLLIFQLKKQLLLKHCYRTCFNQTLRPQPNHNKIFAFQNFAIYCAPLPLRAHHKVQLEGNAEHPWTDQMTELKRTKPGQTEF